jgi:hypothetical protein
MMYVRDRNLEPYLMEHSASDAALNVGAIQTHEPDYCGADKRREPRFATNEPASIHSLNPLTPGYTPVRILDISNWGLKLRGQRFIEPGTQIHVKLGNVFVVGEVRYSIPAGGFFLAGVLVEDAFRLPWIRVGA